MIIRDDNYNEFGSSYSDDVSEESAWEIYHQAWEYRRTDTAKYLMLLEKACEYGSGDAALDLGEYELEKKNYNAALTWYKKATELGKTEGFIRMGDVYWDLEDLTTAKECFISAANLNEAEGMYRLGDFIRKVDRDKYKALYWFEKAANLDHRNGMRAVLASPNNIAELLGIIMHGKLLHGDKFWQEGVRNNSNAFIDYGVINEEISCMQDLSSTIKDEIFSHNQEVIGYAVKNNHYGVNGYFIFTDEAIYIQDDDGDESGIWYKLIEGVKATESNLLIMHHGGAVFEVPNAKYWAEILAPKRLRLFLLMAANSSGSQYDFSIQERIQLSNVRLRNWQGKSVLWTL